MHAKYHVIIINKRDLLKQIHAKIKGIARRFGVVMTPLSRVNEVLESEY